MWLLTSIRILVNELFGHILIFSAFFEPLVGNILNDFENVFRHVIVFSFLPITNGPKQYRFGEFIYI
jgi:hypothetical protein